MLTGPLTTHHITNNTRCTAEFLHNNFLWDCFDFAVVTVLILVEVPFICAWSPSCSDWAEKLAPLKAPALRSAVYLGAAVIGLILYCLGQDDDLFLVSYTLLLIDGLFYLATYFKENVRPDGPAYSDV